MTERKKANGWNRISAAVLALLILAEAAIYVRIWELNMIPAKYLGVLLGVMAIVTLLLCPFLFQRTGKWQSQVRHTKQITAYVLCGLITVGCTAGFFAVHKLDTTVEAISEPPAFSENIGVYILAENPAQSIEDGGAQWIYGTSADGDLSHSQSTLAAVQELLGTAVYGRTYDSPYFMIDGLYAGEVNAVVLNTAYADILSEVEGYTDFFSRTKLIYEHSIQEAAPNQEGEEMLATGDYETPTGDDAVEIPETTGPLDPTKSPFIVYLSGSDTRNRTLTKSRSDVNILAVINPVSKQILLVNTPRDYYVQNPAGNGAMDKLTHCGLYGLQCSADALSMLYNQPVSYYAQINFAGFERLINAIGGIKVHSDFGFSTSGNLYQIHRGDNYMDGAMALAFARERHNVSGGDNTRGKNQMKVIQAIVTKLTTSEKLFTKYFDILDSLGKMFVTNMPAEEISDLISMQLDDMASWEFLNFAVTGSNGNEGLYSTGGRHAYVMYPNEEDVAKASDLMGRVLQGEILTQDDLQPAG